MSRQTYSKDAYNRSHPAVAPRQTAELSGGAGSRVGLLNVEKGPQGYAMLLNPGDGLGSGGGGAGAGAGAAGGQAAQAHSPRGSAARRTQGGGRIFASGELVSSSTSAYGSVNPLRAAALGLPVLDIGGGGVKCATDVGIPPSALAAPVPRLERWWHSSEVLHLVYEYVGVHQVFVGEVQDDTQRLFHFDVMPNVGGTALVCKQWSMTARTMTTADFRPLRYSMTDQSLDKALSSMRYLKCLYLTECRRVRLLKNSFDFIGRNVVVLSLVGCTNITDAALFTATRAMPRLKELYVPACTKLEKVSIATQYRTSEDGVARMTSELEVLDVSANNLVTDEAIERLVREHVHLKELFLSQLDNLTMPDVASPVLELLNLDGCENLSFSTALRMMKRCPGLRYLTLGDNDKMMSDPHKRFCRMDNLVELNISATFHNDDTVNTALENIPNLTLLDCGNSEFVVKPRLRHPKLEILVLNMCCELEDTAFDDLNEKLPSLRHLSCNHCDTLTRPSLRHETLVLLDFSNCAYLLSDHRATPWLDCPRLSTLYLGHTQHVTDKELAVLFPSVPAVVDLNLYQASGVHAPDLTPLTEVCRGLFSFSCCRYSSSFCIVSSHVAHHLCS